MSSKTKVRKETPKVAKPSVPSEEVASKKIKTHELKLNAEELVHLRDLMSVMLPPDGATTLSQSLANTEKRTMVEAKLWAKIVELCTAAGIPINDDAPDFAVGIVGAPSLAVFPLHLTSDED